MSQLTSRIISSINRYLSSHPISLSPESFCDHFINSSSSVSLPLSSSAFTLHDFSLSMSPPPISGYRQVVTRLLQKCLPWKYADSNNNFLRNIKPCRGRHNPSLKSTDHRDFALWSKWVRKVFNCNQISLRHQT